MFSCLDTRALEEESFTMMADDLPEVKDNLNNVLELSHKDVIELLDQELNDVIKDPLLRDLPSYPTVEEIKSRIALEKGKAIIINLKLQGEIDTVIQLVIEQTATVQQLKSTIERYVTLKIERETGQKHISWRYIWKTYWLLHNGEKLIDEKKPIREYGISDNANLSFIKRLRRK
ncbi:U11/U12 small nuclear ribonucleoprotein 25 kDa protein-like [Rhopilema esculentum]|uniref:U11/U12 small nuclear ribonucleoprotein 25 kDa protein-like n=1 Tax=Rhopilema esculentum TaxID=499914 RepID=UPI0031CFE57C